MQRWQSALRVLEVGWFVGIAILLGILGGLWVDNKLGTRPLFIIVGLVLGLAIAIIGAVKLIMPIIRGDNDKGSEL